MDPFWVASNAIEHGVCSDCCVEILHWKRRVQKSSFYFWFTAERLQLLYFSKHLKCNQFVCLFHSWYCVILTPAFSWNSPISLSYWWSLSEITRHFDTHVWRLFGPLKICKTLSINFFFKIKQIALIWDTRHIKHMIGLHCRTAVSIIKASCCKCLVAVIAKARCSSVTHSQFWHPHDQNSSCASQFINQVGHDHLNAHTHKWAPIRLIWVGFCVGASALTDCALGVFVCVEVRMCVLDYCGSPGWASHLNTSQMIRFTVLKQTGSSVP